MSDSDKLCPICGAGHLQPQVGKSPVEYKGQATELDLHFSVCDACGSEQSDAAQLRDNKRAMVAFKKQVDGLLTGAEVRALREKLGLSQADAAKVFGGGPVAFSKYESDDVAQSEAMDKLLRLAAEDTTIFDALARKAGVGQAVAWTNVDAAVIRSPVHRSDRPQLRVISSSTTEEEPHWSDAA